MKVLVVGKGGRESAIVWRLVKDNKELEIYTAPGNPYTARFGRNIDIREDDVDSLVSFAKDENIDLVFPGGETSIALGIADKCEKEGIRVIAPKEYAAKLESSKIWAKEFMKRYGIPTADFETFDEDEFEESIRFVENSKYPLVIKADGLAGGKGTVIVRDFKEAVKVLEDFIIKGKFKEASKRVVIERFLKGEEVSVFIISDGKKWEYLGFARDFKRLYDGDEGPNTGGMGSIAPVYVDEETERLIRENVVKRTLEGIRKEGFEYLGILYFGLMITENGPFVLEYNVRLGDPEAQALLPILKGNFLDAVLSAADGNLDERTLEGLDGYSCCVVLASKGYPEKPETGKEISGIDEARKITEYIFFSGVREVDGKLYTSGGRVLSVVGTDKDTDGARKKSYEAVSKIKFEGMIYRKDIGW